MPGKIFLLLLLHVEKTFALEQRLLQRACSVGEAARVTTDQRPRQPAASHQDDSKLKRFIREAAVLAEQTPCLQRPSEGQRRDEEMSSCRRCRCRTPLVDGNRRRKTPHRQSAAQNLLVEPQGASGQRSVVSDAVECIYQPLATACRLQVRGQPQTQYSCQCDSARA